MKNLNRVTRRRFIKTTAGTAAAFTIVPSYAVSGLGHVAPSDKLNIAGIGIGGKGKVNLQNMVDQNIVALCDVDWDYAMPVFQQYPKAKRFKDFREMLDQQKDIDAVVVATPDHTHAIAAVTAMRAGKHVYVQKPLTHSVSEARLLTETAIKTGVVTQMGNEGHSDDSVYEVAEIIQSGILGDIREAHAWTNRPIWPQGLERPAQAEKIPATLDWELFLGPAAFRPYHSAYTPWSWRAWWDFGTGALGDMGCHILDVPFYALNLKYPVTVEASSTVCNTESAPEASRVEYTFPEREKLENCNFPEVKVTWHDGGLMPPRPRELPDGEPMGGWGGGNLFIGSKGKLVCDYYGRDWKLLLPGNEKPVTSAKLPRYSDDPLGGGRHEMQWVRACMNGKEGPGQTSSNFAYAGPLSEMVLMGNLAIRLQGLNRPLHWDGEKMKFTNISPNDKFKIITSHRYKKIDGQPQFYTDWTDELPAAEMANIWINHTYRDGWKI